MWIPDMCAMLRLLEFEMGSPVVVRVGRTAAQMHMERNVGDMAEIRSESRSLPLVASLLVRSMHVPRPSLLCIVLKFLTRGI